MKTTGIIRRLDSVGRIVIPSEIREIFDWNIADPIEVYLKNNSIILRSCKHYCFFCGGSEQIRKYKTVQICMNCISEMKELY